MRVPRVVVPSVLALPLLLAGQLPAAAAAPTALPALSGPASVAAVASAPAPAAVPAAVAPAAAVAPQLDPRCRIPGKVLCIDKSDRVLRVVRDGQVVKTMSARFGGSRTPTREGTFKVYWKSRSHVSSIYRTSMPYAMFFSGGQAVHYSPDFARNGYAGASHGCVNLHDYRGAGWLFDWTPTGTRVVVAR